MTESMPQYEDSDVVVFGVSVDSALAQKVWADKENISVTLLSDYTKSTVRDYGVVLENFLGMGEGSKRAAFVIDKEGTVKYSEVTPTPPEQPDFDAIKSVLSSLK